MRTILYSALLSCLAGGLSAQTDQAAQPEQTFAYAATPAVAASRHMVVAAHPLAAAAGRAALAAGGSAADAAVAVQMMLGLVEPQSSGIGGGMFLLHWDASEGRLTTLDGRETAPGDADQTYWLDDTGAPVGWWDAVIGGRSVGVPGTVMLLEDLHIRHGRLPWADLLAPAIRTATQGFQVSARMAASIAGAEERGLKTFPEATAYFFDQAGAPLRAGALLTNPDYAATLRLLAAHGASPFYEGAIAGDIVEAVRTDANPGVLTLTDMAGYEAIARAPVCIDYRGYRICGMGPPSSGALTVGQILGVLSNFDLPAMGDGPAAWHLYAEAAKLAYADRGLYMADSDYVRMPVKGLLDPDYLASRAALIDPAAAMQTAEPGAPPWDDAALRAPDTDAERPGTTHFVIVDSRGDMVSATSSIETGFGSRLMTGGFLLNNQLTDFSRAPDRDGAPIANRVEGGKRPRSSMSPTIVLRDGAPVLLIGSPGGSRIINYVAAALIRILDWNMDPAEALAAGHIVSRGGAIDLEQDMGLDQMGQALTALGHEVRFRNLNSGLHAIQINGDALIGAADPRREGVALGD